MQEQLPIRIEYLDDQGVMHSTELFYGLHDAEVRQALLQQAGFVVLRWVRQTIEGSSYVDGSQAPGNPRCPFRGW